MVYISSASAGLKPFMKPNRLSPTIVSLLLGTMLGPWCGTVAAKEAVAMQETSPSRVGSWLTVRRFLPDRSLTRVGRPVTVTAVVANLGDGAHAVDIRAIPSTGLHLRRGQPAFRASIEPGTLGTWEWRVDSDSPGLRHLRWEVVADGVSIVDKTVPIRFLKPRPITPMKALPPPRPAPTKCLIGAHYCPLWEADKPHMWRQIRKHPERIPALGFYAQENPEIADWETTWAVEHGIDFFIYCWYRTSQGKPVEQMFGSALHEAFFPSRHAGAMRFTIMWENQRRGFAGVADEEDLFTHLLPFWMEHYFKHPSYLVVDNRPVLFVYRPEFLIQDLGGIDRVARAFDGMREACRREGFDGLTILGEYRGLDRKHLELMKQLGLDYTFAYCWGIPGSPSPREAVDKQMALIEKTREMNVLPQVVTLSQAWSGWHDEGSIWKIPPKEYKDLLRRGKAVVESMPADSLSGRMLLLDNWNEWGEGHYIAPYTEYGFGYLDAVREVFSAAPARHEDLIPEDLGMGPYDTAYRAWLTRDEALYPLLARRVVKPGGEDAGLVGWWTFDEESGSPVALDYSGHRRGGRLIQARRVPGIEGKALLCDGGCVSIPYHPALSILRHMTLECWAKTDRAGQGNTWMVNRVFGGATDTGYRLGILAGKPCFEIPWTSWSHHLSADIPMPTGRWVHVAGVFDGRIMRLYVDGVERGSMERPGPIKANDFKLCLGNFDEGHRAHFEGLLDEVRLYSRALSAVEIRRHAARRASEE